MDELLSSSAGVPYAQLCNIEYHQLENMRLRKEISESFGILHAVQDCCVQLGIIVDGPTVTDTVTTPTATTTDIPSRATMTTTITILTMAVMKGVTITMTLLILTMFVLLIYAVVRV